MPGSFPVRASWNRESGSSQEGTAWDWFSPEELPADLLPYARAWLADAAAGRSQVTLR